MDSSTLFVFQELFLSKYIDKNGIDPIVHGFIKLGFFPQLNVPDAGFYKLGKQVNTIAGYN
jgi:hypothetical protein